MKNRINTILLLVCLFLVITIFYQNKLQNDSEKRLKDSIVNDWEERKKIEDSIRNEMDSKRNNQEFIMKLDYQRELEEMLNSKIAILEEGISTLKTNFVTEVNSRLSGYEGRILSFNQETEVRLKELQERLEQQDKLRNESDSFLNQRLKSFEDNQEKYLFQINSLKQAIRDLREKQIGLEKQIKENSAKIKAQAVKKDSAI